MGDASLDWKSCLESAFNPPKRPKEKMVNIRGLNKPVLLHLLYHNQKIPEYEDGRIIPYSLQDAERTALGTLNLMTVFGREIGCDLSKDEVDVSMYDEQAGKGMFEKVISLM